MNPQTTLSDILNYFLVFLSQRNALIKNRQNSTNEQFSIYPDESQLWTLTYIS